MKIIVSNDKDTTLENLFIPSLKIEGLGDYSNEIDIEPNLINEIFDPINCMIGRPIKISSKNALEYTSAFVEFRIKDEVLKNHTKDNLRIAYFDTLNNSIEILDTSVDADIVSAEFGAFGYYLLMDIRQYYLDLDHFNQMRTLSTQTWVRLENGSLVLLDKDPSLGDYDIDTDGDGIPDLIELNKKSKIVIPWSGIRNEFDIWGFTTNPAKQDTDGDGIKDGLDINPNKYDVRIIEETSSTIRFNNGIEWKIFGKDIYRFRRYLYAGALTYTYDPTVLKDLDLLASNEALDLDEFEVALLAMFDINGVRSYLNIKDKELRENVFKVLTGREPKYYKYSWTNKWEEIEPRDEKWYDFVTGDIKSEADATLTIYYSVDLNRVIKGVVFAGIIIGATYLGVAEITLLAKSTSVYGLYNTLTMYFNGGSNFLQVMLADYQSDGDSDLKDIAVYVDEVIRTTDDVWGEPPVVRGKMIDERLGNNLGNNFPVVDRLENGILTSIKSIDTKSITYQSGPKLYSRIVRDIKTLDEFTNRIWNNVEVRTSMYHSKVLEIAIPYNNLTLQQLQGIEAAKSVAAEYGIDIIIKIISQ